MSVLGALRKEGTEMMKLLTALIALAAVAIAATAAFACNDTVQTPAPPQVQAPPPDAGTGS